MNTSPRFQIVNTSPKNIKGTHWLLLVAIQSTFKSSTKQKKKQEVNKHCNQEQPENSSQFFHSFPRTI